MTTSGTIEFWFNKPTSAGQTPFMGFDDETGRYEGYRMFVSDNYSPGYLSWYSSAGNAGPADSNSVAWGDLPLFDQWSHIVLAWGDGSVQMYLNGAQIMSSGYAGVGEIDYGGATGSANFIIGNIVGLVGHYEGLIDEVSLYNNKLTSTDASDHYNAGLAGMVPEPTSLAVLGLGFAALASRSRRRP
jgi:hypothetical protein